MLCDPAVSALVLHAACPAATATSLHRIVAPSVNVTVPFGVPPETVAVNVTDCPTVAGLADDTSAVVVVVTALVSAMLSVPPTEIAVTFCPAGTTGAVECE